MASQLIEHERIRTTVLKAKEVQRVAEWLVTVGKKGRNLHNIRQANKMLPTQDAVNKLFDTIGPRYQLRPGGCTRVLKIGWRKGDAADMAIIEFVDREGEVRKARPVSAETVARNHAAKYPSYSSILPSRNRELPR